MAEKAGKSDGTGPPSLEKNYRPNMTKDQGQNVAADDRKTTSCLSAEKGISVYRHSGGHLHPQYGGCHHARNAPPN